MWRMVDKMAMRYHDEKSFHFGNGYWDSYKVLARTVSGLEGWAQMVGYTWGIGDILIQWNTGPDGKNG